MKFINFSNIIYPIVANISKINYSLNDTEQDAKSNSKQKVYIIGNGWGSYYFTKHLDKNKFNPIIIAPNKKVLDTPKLTKYLMDSNAVIEFDNPNGEIINDMLEDIDLENKLLITKSGSKYKFDKVVMSIGSEPNDFGIPGVNEFAYKFKTIQDADLLRERIKNLYTRSKIYIVGTGVTGIEMASKLNNVGCEIRMIEGLGEILPGYKNETKQLVMKEFESNYKNVEIILNNMVKSINKYNYIKTFDNLSRTELFYPFNYRIIYNEIDIVIWTGGVRFCGFGKTILFEKLNKIVPIKPRGLDVNEDFTIDTDKQIYCIGDMVANKGPPTAQNAKNQGKWLAEYFNSNMDFGYIKTNPYEIKSNGKLIHLDKNTIIETEYYMGFVPKFINRIIDFFLQ